MDHIHGDKFSYFCDVIFHERLTQKDLDNNIEALTTKNCLIFCKTDFLFNLFEVLKDIEGRIPERKYLLITHNSDYAIDETYWNKKPNNVLRWYALNVDYKASNLIPIPSGMERPLGCGYSSDYGVIESQLKKERTFKNLCYMNFNENNNHGERDTVLEHFKERDWVTYKPLGVSFLDYIDNCYNHKFIISPPGNGIDCHRTWEALYLGSIPIVKRSVLTDFFRDLPIMIVEDYTLLNKELLEHIWVEFQEATKYSLEKLDINYWKNRILSDKENLLND